MQTRKALFFIIFLSGMLFSSFVRTEISNEQKQMLEQLSPDLRDSVIPIINAIEQTIYNN